MSKQRIVIMGAAERDFHNFNTVFRENDRYEVVAFAATQIPNIEGRRYPSQLAGNLYPDGIPIFPESKLADLIHTLDVDQVVFAYSDVNLKYGAGIVAARRFGAAEIVDPRPYTVGTITDTFEKSEIGPLLPAMGYGEEQVHDLEETIRRVPCDLVITATPIDLTRVAKIYHVVQRVRYELQVIGQPTLEDVLTQRLG